MWAAGEQSRVAGLVDATGRDPRAKSDQPATCLCGHPRGAGDYRDIGVDHRAKGMDGDRVHDEVEPANEDQSRTASGGRERKSVQPKAGPPVTKSLYLVTKACSPGPGFPLICGAWPTRISSASVASSSIRTAMNSSRPLVICHSSYDLVRRTVACCAPKRSLPIAVCRPQCAEVGRTD